MFLSLVVSLKLLIIGGFLSSGSHAEFTETAIIKAEDGGSGRRYGNACTVNNGTMFVTCPWDDAGNGDRSGSVYVYEGAGDTWTQEQKLTADDGVDQDRFGVAVCTQENLAIVTGSRCGGVGGENGPGCFYVFTRASPGEDWNQVGKVVPSDGVVGDAFGNKCALEGNTLLIGAYNRDDDRGAVYVFTNPSGDDITWEEEQILEAPEGDQIKRFGGSLAISGDTAVVGLDWFAGVPALRGGAAYVFTRSGSNWSQQAKLEPSSRVLNFGKDVAIEGDLIAVGSAGRSRKSSRIRGGDLAYNIGSVAIFKRTGATWTEDQVIAPGGLFVFFGGAFGKTLALNGDTLAIGAPDTKFFRNWRQGTLYVYKRDGVSSPFVQESKIRASDGRGAPLFGINPFRKNLDDQFPQGINFDDDGKTLCASTYFTNNGGSVDEGTAYVFVDNK